MATGVAGACGCGELYRLTVDDAEEKGDILFVKIPITKAWKARSFVVSTDSHVQICKKYSKLRPKNISYGNFNTFGKIPSTITQYLNLFEPHGPLL